MFNLFKRAPVIEFICEPQYFGNIPSPIPSRKVVPSWYKALPIELHNGLENGSLKKCPPFLDAMVAGWIIPLVADVEIKSNADCSGVEYTWGFDKPLIQNHKPDQVSASKCPAPTQPKPPMKWLNYWAIKCPPGYSLLFMPLLNRADPRFTIFSGMVDADGYFEYINFPFVWNEPNFHGVIPAGTPLAQVIPIRRDTLFHKHVVRAFTPQDEKELMATRTKRSSHFSLYRDYIWSRK